MERKSQIKDCSSFINRPEEKKKKTKTEFKKIGQITLNFLVKRLFECWPQGQARAGSGQWGGGQRAVHPGEGGT